MTRTLWMLFILATTSSVIFSAPSKSFIIRLKPGENVRALFSRLNAAHELEELVPQMNLYLVRARNSENALQNFLARNRAVSYFHEDSPVTLRVTPNDTWYEQQWSMPKIEAPAVWEAGTGGHDKLGRDVVIAIVDAGFDTQHKDLAENLWVNRGEVEGNGLDDDGNGFVDDIHGWNAYNRNGTLPSDNHGTHVSGIAGAVGNNGRGVAGVNWRSSLMFVAGSTSSSAVIARAYGYVMKQKQLWLQSKGQRGANVVATNSSFGINYANCDSSRYRVWNDLYEEMGKLGILSAVAAPNKNVNVDRVGDVPSGCKSTYILKVTNTTKTDSVGTAGTGKLSITIGAPGTGIVSTIMHDNYSPMTGTSMATPHVAGAVGFLFHLASVNFLDHYEKHPQTAALEIKRAIVEGVDKVSSLQNQSVSGGRLNLRRSAEIFEQTLRSY